MTIYLYELDFFHKAPFHGVFVRYLYNQYYEKVKSKVNAWLYIFQFLNFYINKLNNI